MRRETATAIRAAATAQSIADSRRGAEDVRRKGGIDLVTATDIACEDAIRAELMRDFPPHAIVGEERGGSQSPDRPYWLVDPICGTRPFASNLPLYCCNVALVENGEVTVAAVGVGRTGEIAWAERGGGAFIWCAEVDRPIRTSADSDTLWFSGSEPHAVDIMRHAMHAKRWYLWQFSSTISYVYLATGGIAGIVHSGTSAVHVAAGRLLAEEAGAVVSDADGKPWQLASPSLLAAATPELHAELRALVERSRPALGIRGFDHLALTATDVERTLAFYRDVLGAQVLYEEEWRRGRMPVIVLQIGANRINVHPARAPVSPHAVKPTPGAVDLCFRWDAPLDDAVTRLARYGVTVEEGPVPRPAADGQGGRSVYFRDPDGNLLELLSTVS